MCTVSEVSISIAELAADNDSLRAYYQKDFRFCGYTHAVAVHANIHRLFLICELIKILSLVGA